MPCTASVEVTLVHRGIRLDHKGDKNARAMPKESCAEEERRIRRETKSEGRASLSTPLSHTRLLEDLSGNGGFYCPDRIYRDILI